MIQLSVKGIPNVAKLISALDKAQYTFHIWTDSEQAWKLDEDIWFEVEIADRLDGQRFKFESEEE